MVSTRGPRSKFAVGEKVLCYEPDPTKARVLYDSKVLKVIVKTDKDGHKTLEYLIHFQGWNSSWDRYVSEDFVLKHTDENFRLQRKLAEKAQLRPGAYLYRRDRKEPKLNNIPSEAYLTETRDIQHNIVASSTSCGGSVSSYSVHSIDTDGNDNSKRNFVSNKQKMGKESVMDGKQRHCSHSENVNTKSVCSGVSKDRQSIDSGTGEDGLEFDEYGYEVGDFTDDKYDRLHSEHFSGNDNPENSDIRINTRSTWHERNKNRTQSEDCVRGYIEENNFALEISDVMKEILELDNELIKNGNKLVRLPANPNVVAILESYVRDYTISQICSTPGKSRHKYKPHPCHQNNSLDLEQINKSINISREVADGVRVYFDFTLSGLLLYNEEREQYEQCNHMIGSEDICSTPRFATATESKSEANGNINPAGCGLLHERSSSITNQDNLMQLDRRAGISIGKKYSRHRHTSSEGQKCSQLKDNISCKETEKQSLVMDVPNSTTCFPLLSKEQHDNTVHDKLSSVTSNSSMYLSQSGKSILSSVKEALSARGCSFNLSDFPVSHISDWNLVPESLYESKPVLPSLVYGAVHLARLFVKLPGLLVNANIPAKKLKIVLRHLQMILRYLEKNKRWFGENAYQDTLIQEKTV